MSHYNSNETHDSVATFEDKVAILSIWWRSMTCIRRILSNCWYWVAAVTSKRKNGLSSGKQNTVEYTALEEGDEELPVYWHGSRIMAQGTLLPMGKSRCRMLLGR